MEWENVSYTAWTDYMVTLHWLHKLPNLLKTFVANRVASIQANTDIAKWRHVGTKENPADILSRGINAKGLVESQIWLYGPKWLTLQPSEWPSNTFVPAVLDAGRHECRVVNVALRVKDPLMVYIPAEKKAVPLMERCGKLEKVFNVLARVYEFINKLKARREFRKSKRRRTLVNVTNDVKVRAMTYLIQETQEMHFGKDLAQIKKVGTVCVKSSIEPLKPILDTKSVLRVGGRLNNLELTYELRHPVVVPNGSRLAWLIIDNAHRRTMYGGGQVMTQFIRQKYWIPRLRSEIRKYLHKCVACARQKGEFESQLMADLPKDRVTCGKAFEVTGVDFAGPYKVKVGKGKRGTMEKCWIAIFVCLKTRAVHIDVVTNLTIIAFIACFERFIGRRGRCIRMYSDNGTTFRGAEKELKAAYDKWAGKEAVDHLNAKGTEWKFMMPAAPHQGGIYEAAVKSMKFHMTRVIGLKVLEYEQLLTLLTGIEAIMNSRPLYPLSEDPSDMQALTPGHFLVGEPLILPLPSNVPEKPVSRAILLWKDRKKMLEHFWERWKQEYLTTLQERKKWRREKAPLQVGQLVLLRCENVPPAVWPMGRVKELIASHDGKVRSVVVKTKDSEFKRAVQKLCIVPVSDEDQP